MLGLPFDLDRTLGSSMLDRLFRNVTEPIQIWLAAHPVWHWLFNHPLWLLGLIVVGLFLFAGLLGAIARLTETLWLGILQAPFKLLQWLFTGLMKLVKLPFAAKAPSQKNATAQAERLTAILNRLDAMHQEQEELMQEVREILAVTSGSPPTVDPAINSTCSSESNRLLPSAAEPLPPADLSPTRLLGSTPQQQ